MEFSSRLQYKPFSFNQILRKIFLQIINLVQMLPRKIYICTAKMSVCRSLFVDRAAEIKHFDDSSRTKVKVLTDDLYQFRIRYFTCAKCFYMNRSRMCNTNCIGKLPPSFPRSYPGEIRLYRFSRSSATAVTGHLLFSPSGPVPPTS